MAIQDSYAGGPLIMMSLGDFLFGINTAVYQELGRSTEWRWPSQDRFNQSPVLQFVGPGADTISLPGVVYPEWRGGLAQIETMRAMADLGEPLMMIDGTGAVWGQWVIEKVDEKQSVLAAAGIPRKQEFTLSLKKYDDEGIDTMAFTGGASSSSSSTAADTGGVGGAIGDAISGAASVAGGISGALDKVNSVAHQLGDQVNAVVGPINRALDVANGLKNAAMDAKAMLGSSVSAIAQASSLKQLLNAASGAVTNSSQAGASLRRALDKVQAIANIPGTAIGAVQGAVVSVNKLTVAATKVQAQASTLIKDLFA